MATKDLTGVLEVVERHLDLLIRNWATLPTMDEFATWDEDDQVDYLVEFQADLSNLGEVRDFGAAGVLSQQSQQRLAHLEQLIERRKPEYDALVKFDG